jgi:putative colanic acid biosynthesis UDP-glucose lipid carrier transferase
MNEPFVPKPFFAVAVSVVAIIQAVAPATIAVLCLYAVVAAYGLEPAPYFDFLALAVALLALVVLRLPRTAATHIVAGTYPVIVAMTVRWLFVLVSLLAVGYVTKFSHYYSRRVVLTWALLTPAMITIGQLGLQELLRRLLRDPTNVRRAVIAGCTDSSIELGKRLMCKNDHCISVVGFFDDRCSERLRVNGDVQLLGRLADLPAFVKRHGVEMAFIAIPIRQVSRVLDLVEQLRDTTASIYYLPDIYVFDLIQSRGEIIDGIPVISMCETPFNGNRAAAKRLTDVLLTALMLFAMTPVMLIIALAVRATSPGPVIFKQRRYGLNGDEITIYKFRTMTVIEDGQDITQVTQADPRVTAVGRFLRRYSLDELPQLINVLQGRMSLVGPRPHAVAHNEAYRRLIKGYMVRHKVLPGITGLAQVNGLRGETRTLEQMEARVRYDLEYLRGWSVELDLEILARTVMRVLNDPAAY